MTEIEMFKKKFSFSKNDFSKPVDLQDAGIGFSVYKDQKDLKREGFKSIFKIYITKEELNKQGNKKSIIITASYGKETNNGIISNTTDLSEFKRGLNWPAELISKNEFFYDIETNDFLYQNKSITGREILNKINDWHLKPTRIDGFWHIIKLFYFHKILAGFFKVLFYIISGFQYLISGQKVNFYLRVENQISPKNTPGKLITIFDYQVEIWIAVIYAIIHLLIVYPISFYYNYKPNFLVNIFKNNFLTILYVIISLGLTDSLLSKLPKIYFTKKILTFIQEKYYIMASKSIKL